MSDQQELSEQQKNIVGDIEALCGELSSLLKTAHDKRALHIEFSISSSNYSVKVYKLVRQGEGTAE